MSKSAKVLKISRQEISKRLQINGLQARSEALSIIESELLHGYPPYQSIDQFISLLSQVLLMKCDTNWFIIDADIAHKAIDYLRESRICNTADNQLLVKNVMTSSGESQKNYLNHLNQLQKHLMKHKLFSGLQYKLTPIDSLITSTDESINCIVFGFLFKDPSKISQYLIEDSSGKVPVAFTEDTQWRDSVIVENSFVLIEGTYYSEKDCLYVDTIGLSPPININSSEDESNSCERVGRMIVILSDIHLDDSTTVEKLKVLLTGYNSMVPIPDCFIFVGDFVSKECSDVSDFKGLNLNYLIAI